MKRAATAALACALFAACAFQLDGFTGGATASDAGPEGGAFDATPETGAPDAADLCAGKSCLGGACVAGRCTPAVLAANQPGARGIALHGDQVYWVRSDGSLWRVPKQGGAATMLASATGAKPVALAVDDTGIYITDEGQSAVGRVTLEGASPTVLASGQTSPSGIALDATYVYYVTAGEARRVPKDGTGSPQRVGTANAGADVVVANGRVYWLNTLGADAVDSVAIGDATVQCHFNNQTNPHGLAADAKWVFHGVHAAAPDGKIRRKTLAETCTTDAVEIATGIHSPFELALDATNVVWTIDGADGGIGAMPKDGSSMPVALATGQDSPWGVVVAADGTIYWTNSGANGAVMALVR